MFMRCGDTKLVLRLGCGSTAQMACQHRAQKCRPRCSANLHSAGLCKPLRILAPIRLVIRHVVSEWLHKCFIESIGLPFVSGQ